MIASRSRAVGVLVAALVMGMVGGAFTLMAATRAGKADALWHMGGRRPEGRGRGPDWMQELGLSAGVRDSIEAVWCRGEIGVDSMFTELRPRIDSIWQTVRPQVEARRNQTRQEMRALLTPAQQERYDSIVRVTDEQRRSRRPQGPCGRSGGPGRGFEGGGPRGPR